MATAISDTSDPNRWTWTQHVLEIVTETPTHMPCRFLVETAALTSGVLLNLSPTQKVQVYPWAIASGCNLDLTLSIVRLSFFPFLLIIIYFLYTYYYNNMHVFSIMTGMFYYSYYYYKLTVIIMCIVSSFMTGMFLFIHFFMQQYGYAVHNNNNN
jgi:hypothetical protein